MSDEPRSVAEVTELVRQHQRVLAVGARTKPALSAIGRVSSPQHGSSSAPESTAVPGATVAPRAAAPPGAAAASPAKRETSSSTLAGPDCHFISLRALRGITAYDPGELTFTALAGTPIADIAEALAAHGQYLPFDPPFARRGSTLGGMIAAGCSGPGRERFGGIRDFILGVQFVTGDGTVVKGGGKVVKNAAGFDLPKLLVGSLGRLGVILEATFKVFPRPAAWATLLFEIQDLADALQLMDRLATVPFDYQALEILPNRSVLAVRIGGPASTFEARLSAIRAAGQRAGTALSDDASFWESLEPGLAPLPVPPASAVGQVAPVPGGAQPVPTPHAASVAPNLIPSARLVAKIPVTPSIAPKLDAGLSAAGAERRYSSRCNVAWVDWPKSTDELDSLLRGLGLSGLALTGANGRAPSPLLGIDPAAPLRARVKAALDPADRFPSY